MRAILMTLLASLLLPSVAAAAETAPLHEASLEGCITIQTHPTSVEACGACAQLRDEPPFLRVFLC